MNYVFATLILCALSILSSNCLTFLDNAKKKGESMAFALIITSFVIFGVLATEVYLMGLGISVLRSEVF